MATTAKDTGIVGYSKIPNLDPEKIVVRDGFNPRKEFDAAKIKALADSIESEGVKEPLTVWRNPTTKMFELVNGERRLRAIKLLIAKGKSIPGGVPCNLCDSEEDEIDQLVTALVTNAGEPLSDLEEGDAFRRMIEANTGETVQSISKRIGRSHDYVKVRLDLATKASPEVKEALASGTINKQIAVKAVKAGKDPEKQKAVMAEQKAMLKDGADGKRPVRMTGAKDDKPTTRREAKPEEPAKPRYTPIQQAAIDRMASLGYTLTSALVGGKAKNAVFENENAKGHKIVILVLHKDGGVDLYAPLLECKSDAPAKDAEKIDKHVK